MYGAIRPIVHVRTRGSWPRTADARRSTARSRRADDDFRTLLREANDPARRYIVNFSRDRIFGAGGGHHSPIGGYLEDEDLVFVLDVNRNFQPWLVERARLYEAMNTFDGSKKRGLLLIEQRTAKEWAVRRLKKLGVKPHSDCRGGGGILATKVLLLSVDHF